MLIEMVRASNDDARLGFVSDARRMNVLITRQTVGHWLVGDERCVLTLGQQMDLDSAEVEPEPAGEKKSREDRQNATIIAVFEWLRSKGRLVHIAEEKLRQGSISFAEAEAKTSDTGGGWDNQPDPTTDNI